MEGKITKQPALLLRSSVRPHTVAHFQVTDGHLALELLQALLFSSTYADERTALSFLYDPKPVSQAKGLQFLKGFERINTQPVLFRINLWVKPKPKPKPAVVHLLLITNSDIFPLVFLLKEAFVLDIRSSAIRRNISYTRGSPPPAISTSRESTREARTSKLFQRLNSNHMTVFPESGEIKSKPNRHGGIPI